MRARLNSDWHSKGLIKTPSHPVWKKQLDKVFSSSPTLYVPDAQRGIAAIGAVGSGKTFSVIDPLIRSALDQGFPLCLNDVPHPIENRYFDASWLTREDAGTRRRGDAESPRAACNAGRKAPNGASVQGFEAPSESFQIRSPEIRRGINPRLTSVSASPTLRVPASLKLCPSPPNKSLSTLLPQ